MRIRVLKFYQFLIKINKFKEKIHFFYNKIVLKIYKQIYNKIKKVHFSNLTKFYKIFNLNLNLIAKIII